MNNKGQVLIIFVILLPIILLLLTFIVDYGFLSIEKRKVENSVTEGINFYIRNANNDDVLVKTQKLLNSNLDDVDINIIDTEDYVEITVVKYYKPIFKSILKDNFKVQKKGIKR